MRFMNEFDLLQATRTFKDTPNRLHIVCVVDRLRVWADHNSDGWAYWPKPARAAAKAMDQIDGTTWERRSELLTTDATDDEVIAVLRPIKTFCTRQMREGNMTEEDRDWILGRSA